MRSSKSRSMPSAAEQLAVLRDEVALVRAADLGGDRVAEHVRDIAQPGRPRDHRPVEEAGALAVDEEVAEVRVAVHERARSLAVQRARCRASARM